MRKDIARLVKMLEQQGWRVRYGRKHCMAFPPDRSLSPVTIPSTPSDGRAYANLLADLRKRGAVVA